MKKLFLHFLKGYKRFLSSTLASFPLIFPVACKFYPTCSEYSQEAIGKYGTAKGLFLSFKRICYCHPFSRGGVDVP